MGTGLNLDYGCSTWITDGAQPALWMELNLDYGWSSTWIMDGAQHGFWMGFNLEYGWRSTWILHSGPCGWAPRVGPAVGPVSLACATSSSLHEEVGVSCFGLGIVDDYDAWGPWSSALYAPPACEWAWPLVTPFRVRLERRKAPASGAAALAASRRRDAPPPRRRPRRRRRRLRGQARSTPPGVRATTRVTTAARCAARTGGRRGATTPASVRPAHAPTRRRRRAS